MAMERIDKIIASQGLYSRSDVKYLVNRKRVTVDGKVVTSASQKADVDKNEITRCRQENFSIKGYDKSFYILSLQEKNKKSPIIISGLEFLIKRGYSRINQETVYSSLKVFFETNYPDFTRINLDTTSYHYDSSDKSLSFFNVISNTEEAFEVKIKTISLQEIEISINPLP